MDSEVDGTLLRSINDNKIKDFQLLRSLDHPGLVELDYYLGSCAKEYDRFSALDLSKQELDSHDLWSIRNQISRTLKFLAPRGLYHKSLKPSSVFVCLYNPITVKLTTWSNKDLDLGVVNTEVPIQEFWKQKRDHQEEVCFDDLLRSIVKLVFPYSIEQKSIVFSYPETLKREDSASIKALISSIEYELLFKSIAFSEDNSNCNIEFSSIYSSLRHEKQTLHIDLPNTSLNHVFIQSIKKCRKPLLNFMIGKDLFRRNKNSNFSKLASRLIDVSSRFRSVFLLAFDILCSSQEHLLVQNRYLNRFQSSNNALVTFICDDPTHSRNIRLSSPSVILSNWFRKFPISCISVSSFNFDLGILDPLKVSKLELNDFNDENLSVLTEFTNLFEFFLNDTSLSYDFCTLTLFQNLCSLSLNKCNIVDVYVFGLLPQLTSLSLNRNNIIDISPFSSLQRLTRLSLNENNISDITPITCLQQLTNLSLDRNEVNDISSLSCLSCLTTLSLNENKIADITPITGLQLLTKLSLDRNEITDISALAPLHHLTNLSLNENKISNVSSICFLQQLTSLSLDRNKIIDISVLEALQRLTTLSLNENKISNISSLGFLQQLTSLSLSKNNITDISPLTKLQRLVNLYLDENEITDLVPLSSLHQLTNLSLRSTNVIDVSLLRDLTKLSSLDLRSTLVSQKHQQLYTRRNDLKELLSLFSHVV
ncbi:hypothetical protein RCL1_000705 [Eukaryota sp. TZLM3-RCL]